MSISVSFQGSSIGGSSNSSQGNDNSIEGLKQKIASLNKDLKAALGEQSEAGMQKAKGIQLQIQMAQMKLDQLIQQEADRNSKTQAKSENRLQSETKTIKNAYSENKIDVYV